MEVVFHIADLAFTHEVAHGIEIPELWHPCLDHIGFRFAKNGPGLLAAAQHLCRIYEFRSSMRNASQADVPVPLHTLKHHRDILAVFEV